MSLLSSNLTHAAPNDVLSRLLLQNLAASQATNGSGAGAGSASKLTTLPGLRASLHQAMETSSTSENEDTMSPHRLDSSSLGGKAGNGCSGSSSAARKQGRPLPEELKDEAYWERRRKNNEAAKRSRDARRAKEYEVAIRASVLEQENMKLRVEIASLKAELTKLRCLMFPALQQQQQLQNQSTPQSNGNCKNRDNCCHHDHD